jgi:hypothetical protein
MGAKGRSFANFLRNAQCSLGLHFGQFQYEDYRTCVKVRRCARCNSVESYSAHEYGPWIEHRPECRLIRTCQRCQATTWQELHSYEWRHAVNSANPCAYQKYCVHCGRAAVFGMMIRHAWGNWRPYRNGDGSVRTCKQCGTTQATQSYAAQSNSDHSFMPSLTRNLPDFSGGWHSEDEWQENWTDGWGAYHPDTDWRWHDSDQEE